MKNKKVIKILISILLIIIAAILIYCGIYFSKLTKPQYLVGIGIDRIDEKVTNYTGLNSKYNLGDTFTVKSKLSFNLDSEDYLKKSKTDKEYKEKYNTIKNLSKTTNTIDFTQDKTSKKVLFEVHSLLDNKEKLIDYKYLVENATGYYYLEDVMKKYINDGTSNYFEMYNDDSTTYKNIKYIHNATKEALKNNLDDRFIAKYEVEENINGKNINVNQLSIRLDDKKMHKLLNGMINDLRNDEKANRIITSVYPDFKTYKIKTNEDILDKEESYTINIYTTKYLNKILKYELIHLKGDEKKTYIYEGDSSYGKIYYIEADTIMYSIDITDTGNIVTGAITDSTNKKVGDFKIEKEEDNTFFNFNYDDGEKKHDVNYSSKYSDYKKGVSYNNEKELSFKYIDNKVSILSGTIILNEEVTNTSKINEDVTDALLESTLSDEVNNKYKNKKDRVKERLKK